MMNDTQTQQQEQIDTIMHWLRGNGEVGLFEKQRKSEAELKRVEAEAQEAKRVSEEALAVAVQLSEEFKEVKIFIRGAKWAAGILIAVFTLATGLGANWVVQQVETILSRL